MNGRIMGFHQLVQKLGHSKKQVTPNTSTLQEIQNDWSCYGFHQLVQKLGHSKKLQVTPRCSCSDNNITQYYESINHC